MTPNEIMKIFEDTAYVRMGGTAEELRSAEYLKTYCDKLGKSWIETFPVQMAKIENAVFEADGVQIPCKGYFNCGSGQVEAPLYYLRATDPYSLKQCRGKIVMVDTYMGYWLYQDLLENGAVGFVTFDGNVNYADRDIDQRELRATVHKDNRILGVNINVKDATALIRGGVVTAKIAITQEEFTADSYNLILDLPGQIDEYIVLTAHYDSTSLSNGAYDNMSGSVGILAIAEYFANHPHRYGLRFIWCGSEERGLLGSKAYCQDHEGELDKVALNINLDMIGSTMGKFIAACTCEEKLAHYISYVGYELGFPVGARQDIYSSDSSPFADKGVPAVSFARLAPPHTGTIHNSYDTALLLKAEQMVEDIDFLVAFTDRMANAVMCPVGREIPDSIKEKLDNYMGRKRSARN